MTKMRYQQQLVISSPPAGNKQDLSSLQAGTNEDESSARRRKLMAKFKAISDGPGPKYWFPVPGSDDCPACDKSYQVVDENGRNFTIRPIIYEAMPYKGQSTVVFAWIGLPSDVLDAKVPVMVLVHGGGGTAFKYWVELWAKKGYAAISIAVEGQTDEPLVPSLPNENKFYKSNSHPGPRRQGVYGDWKESIEDQWMFHAVADTILARALLVDSFHEHVDPAKIGLIGISWGGIITCTVAGVTDASGLFSHVIPAYGCGNLAIAKSNMGRALKNNLLYQTLWDPCLYLPNATSVLPSLWISWPEDPTFPMNCFATTYSMIRGPVMLSIIPKLGHGHQPIWYRPESYAFSKYLWSQNDLNVTKHGWSCQISCDAIRVKPDSLIGRAKFYSDFSFDSVKLIWSPDSDDVDASLRKWNTSEAQLTTITSNTVSAEAVIPGDAKAWFMNFYTEHKNEIELIVSSVYQNALPALNVN